MKYETVGFIHHDGPDGIRRHTEVLTCNECGALVSADTFETHDRWHFDHVVTPS